MSFDEVYESWKRQRSRADAPSDFTAEVMARLPTPGPRRGWLHSTLSSPVWRIAACVLAGAACLYRAALVLGLLIPS